MVMKLSRAPNNNDIFETPFLVEWLKVVDVAQFVSKKLIIARPIEHGSVEPFPCFQGLWHEPRPAKGAR
jgi:hypothetical protein